MSLQSSNPGAALSLDATVASLASLLPQDSSTLSNSVRPQPSITTFIRVCSLAQQQVSCGDDATFDPRLPLALLYKLRSENHCQLGSFDKGKIRNFMEALRTGSNLSEYLDTIEFAKACEEDNACQGKHVESVVCFCRALTFLTKESTAHKRVTKCYKMLEFGFVAWMMAMLAEKSRADKLDVSLDNSLDVSMDVSVDHYNSSSDGLLRISSLEILYKLLPVPGDLLSMQDFFHLVQRSSEEEGTIPPPEEEGSDEVVGSRDVKIFLEMFVRGMKDVRKQVIDVGT